jgi:hypothetical protein
VRAIAQMVDPALDLLGNIIAVDLLDVDGLA